MSERYKIKRMNSEELMYEYPINRINIEDYIIKNFSLIDFERCNISILLDFLLSKESGINRICLVGTPYGLLLYLLYVGDFTNTLFVFYGNYPLIDAISKLRNYGVVCLCVSNDKLTKHENTVNQCLVDYISSNLSQFAIDVYGQDTAPIISNFINDNFALFEDGRISYISREDANRTNGFHVNIYDVGIKKIIYTGLEEIPSDLKKIAHIISIEEYWNRLSQTRQAEIMEIFGFSPFRLKEIIMSGRDTILFTRNYSKVGKCSEFDHVQMYKEILSHYNLNNVIIKPHPNDDVIYEDYFKDCVVLPKKMPAELIWLNKLPIKTVVSVDASSNIFGTFKGKIKVDLYPDMLRKYHVIRTRKEMP